MIHLIDLLVKFGISWAITVTNPSSLVGHK